MSMMQNSRELQTATQVFTRSLESCAFEEFWRGLRGPSLIPARKDFNLARAARFIRDLVLIEAPHPDREGMRIRIASESYQRFAGRDLSGVDHLDLMAPEFRDGARITGELMVTTPCGLWQISPLHSESSRLVEVTAFPLGAGSDGIALLLCHVRTIDGVPAAAAQYQFLDIGTGLPDVSAA